MCLDRPFCFIPTGCDPTVNYSERQSKDKNVNHVRTQWTVPPCLKNILLLAYEMASEPRPLHALGVQVDTRFDDIKLCETCIEIVALLVVIFFFSEVKSMFDKNVQFIQRLLIFWFPLSNINQTSNLYSYFVSSIVLQCNVKIDKLLECTN